MKGSVGAKKKRATSPPQSEQGSSRYTGPTSGIGSANRPTSAYRGPTSGVGSAGRGEYQNRSTVWSNASTTQQDRASIWANSSGSSSSGGGGGGGGGRTGSGSGGGGGGGSSGGGWAGQPRTLAPNAADTPYRDVVEAAKPWSQAAGAKATDNPTLNAVGPGRTATMPSPAKPAPLKPLTPAKAATASKAAATAKPAATGSARPIPTAKPGQPGLLKPGQAGYVAPGTRMPGPAPKQQTQVLRAPPKGTGAYVAPGRGVVPSKPGDLTGGASAPPKPKGMASYYSPEKGGTPTFTPTPMPKLAPAPKAPMAKPTQQLSATSSAKPLPKPAALKPITTAPSKPNVPPPRPQPNPGGLQPGGGWTPPRDTSAAGLAARPMPSKRYRNGRGF